MCAGGKVPCPGESVTYFMPLLLVSEVVCRFSGTESMDYLTEWESRGVSQCYDSSIMLSQAFQPIAAQLS